MAQKRLNFRREGKKSSAGEVVQRLDAEPVTRTEQRSSLRVPDRERKHPAEIFYAIRAVFFICVNDCLGVAACCVAMSRLLEFRTKRRMIENLTVVGDPDRARFVRHRLVAAGKIDNAEPPMSEIGDSVLVNALPVRAAMADGVHHPSQIRFRRRLPLEVYESGYSAHGL